MYSSSETQASVLHHLNSFRRIVGFLCRRSELTLANCKAKGRGMTHSWVNGQWMNEQAGKHNNSGCLFTLSLELELRDISSGYLNSDACFFYWPPNNYASGLCSHGPTTDMGDDECGQRRIRATTDVGHICPSHSLASLNVS
jgi:hypothetical protein